MMNIQFQAVSPQFGAKRKPGTAKPVPAGPPIPAALLRQDSLTPSVVPSPVAAIQKPSVPMPKPVAPVAVTKAAIPPKKPAPFVALWRRVGQWWQSLTGAKVVATVKPPTVKPNVNVLARLEAAPNGATAAWLGSQHSPSAAWQHHSPW